MLSGILLFWLLLHIKDMLLLNGPAPDKALERLCICIDILALPTCAFLLLELTSPGWFNWRRAVIFELPFIALLAIFAIFPVKAIFYIDICCALIFSLWIIARLFRAIPDYNRILRENFSNTENLDLEWLWKLLIFFIILLSLWAYSALHISTPADILYNVSSGIMWCVICYAIYKQQPLILAEETEPVPSEPSVTTDTIRPDFTKKLSQLFDEQKIWLNPRLTLGEVAQLLGSNRTYLSDYLNHKLGTSFYEYVNEYRIRAVEKLHANLHVYINLIRHIGKAGFKGGELKELQAKLTEGDGGALASFGRLSEILDSLDRRGNFIGLILFNMFALSDYFLVRKFLKWQRAYMPSIGEWMDCVSRIDALVSMGTFRFNEPKAVEAVIEDTDGVVFEAEGLYHPFLGDEAVRNDFTVSDGEYYIITGANMAGKSTFLRSVGVNYILAMNGLPVFAANLRVSAFNLFTSMRTSDDLSRGISYFNAELLRLRQLLGSCRQARRTLIILDEILKGTNSLDKLNGSRLFLQAVAKLPVTGIIATHDLELSKMEDDDPRRFHNWCFEIELADDITYTYKITRGVARNQNATFLLKGILGS